MEISYNEFKKDLLTNENYDIYTLEDTDFNIFDYEKCNQESLFLGSYSEILCKNISDKITMCKNIVKTYPNNTDYYIQTIEDFKINIKNMFKKVIFVIKTLVSNLITTIQKFFIYITKKIKFTVKIIKIQSRIPKIKKLVQDNIEKFSNEIYTINGINILNSIPKNKCNMICNYISTILNTKYDSFIEYGKCGKIALYNILLDNTDNKWAQNAKNYANIVSNYIDHQIYPRINTVYRFCKDLLPLYDKDIIKDVSEDLDASNFEKVYNIRYNEFELNINLRKISEDFLGKILACDMYLKSEQLDKWENELSVKIVSSLNSSLAHLENIKNLLNHIDENDLSDDLLTKYNYSVKLLNNITSERSAVNKAYYTISEAVSTKLDIYDKVSEMLLQL